MRTYFSRGSTRSEWKGGDGPGLAVLEAKGVQFVVIIITRMIF